MRAKAPLAFGLLLYYLRGNTMNFTPKANVGNIVRGILIVAAVGLVVWVHHIAPMPAPIAAAQYGFAAQSAVETSPTLYGQASYQPVSHWYKNKYWWKRNAPIIGGAGGGALIGGLAGGGTGALIGGAAGAGGGALYKHLKDKHHHGDAYRSNHGEAYRSTD